jgi:sugar/nucleoside kinase (ribokinase family)
MKRSKTKRASSGVRSGITAAGNWIRDHVKTVDAWPAQDALANILGHTVANGGGPYNVLKDLSKLGASFPLVAIGNVGNDADGESILEECRDLGIDTRQLRGVKGLPTSTTDVMSVVGTGRRTFFHDRGANAVLGPGDIDLAGSRSRIFYLGYLLLLDTLDAPGRDGAPAARAVLRHARATGHRTAVDCVSAEKARFKEVVVPVLPEVDVLFVNDYEAEQVSGIAVGRGAALDRKAVESAARSLLAMGVRQWVVVHFPEGACACSPDGSAFWRASVAIPGNEIKGTAGAGDAFAAGVLYGLHEAWDMGRCLELGVCAAAASLRHPTCSESVPSRSRCLSLGKAWGYRSLP